MGATSQLATVRTAAEACGVTQTAIRRWIAYGRLDGPPWTLQQLVRIRDAPGSRARGVHAGDGTLSRYAEGCSCDLCRAAQSDSARERARAKADARFPEEVRQQLLDGRRAGRLFQAVLDDLDLTPNQVWGMARRDSEWAADLDAVLLATRREDRKHGTNAAYVHGCVCPDCRAHQVRRMAKSKVNNGN